MWLLINWIVSACSTPLCVSSADRQISLRNSSLLPNELFPHAAFYRTAKCDSYSSFSLATDNQNIPNQNDQHWWHCLLAGCCSDLRCLRFLCVMWSRCLRCHLRIFQSRFSRRACKLLPIVQIIIHMNCFFKPCDWRLIDDELKIVVQARAVHRILDTRESLLSTVDDNNNIISSITRCAMWRDVGIMPSKYATLPRYDNEPNKWDAYFVSK